MDPEAVRQAARAEAPQHGRLLRSARDGKRLSDLMLPFFAVWAPPGYALLSTTGRKTGKARRKCLRASRQLDTVFILMLRPPALAIEQPTVLAAWVWNVRANPQVKIRLGRRTFDGVVREITDDQPLAAARSALCDRVHLFDYGECDLHLKGMPTRAKIKALHRYWFDTGVPFAVDLINHTVS